MAAAEENLTEYVIVVAGEEPDRVWHDCGRRKIGGMYLAFC